jgi:aspartate kinase
MKVLKFGGTSVGSPERMHALEKLIASNDRKIVVLSAVAGTTNALVEISSAYAKGNKAEATQLINTLFEKYKTFVGEIYTTDTGKKNGTLLIETHFNTLHDFSKSEFSVFEERAILAQGELLSTALFHYYLDEVKVPSVLLSALDFMRIDEDNEPVLEYIEKHLAEILAKYPDDKLFITQGYICRNAFGEIDNLKRGGSDYSASLIGAAIRSEEIQIWTDIDGMHNNDPRYVKPTFPIAELSFDEAAELAYFGAKILHPSTIWPAKKHNIPVRLLNTMEPTAKGTLIKKEAKGEHNITAIAAKDGIIAIKIKSSRMLLAYGFLRSVFEVFERYKTPIDMITTSEVAVSITIDNPKHLDKIVTDLKEFGTVEVDQDQTIICIVGDLMGDKKGYASMIFDPMKDISIRMISYGGSNNNVSLLINTASKIPALQALNAGLFADKIKQSLQ